MANYKGVIGSLQKSIFNETAKNADNTYKLGQGVAKFAAGGALAGSVGTSGVTMYNNYSEGKNLTNGLGMSALYGAGLGTVVGTGANIVPKVVHNSMAKTGITTFEGFGQIAEELAETWAPVATSLKVAKQKDSSLPKGKSSNIVDSFLKAAKDTKKELKKEGIKKPASSSDYSVRMTNKFIDNFSIDPKGAVDNSVKIANLQQSIGKAAKETLDYTSSNKEGVAALQKWSRDTANAYSKLKKPDKVSVGASLATNLGFKSAYHHIVEPTGDFFNNLRKGNFKNITWEQVAGTAFSGYGLYETGQILSDASEGDLAGVATGLGILAGSKVAYGAAMDYAKLDAIRRAKGVSYSNIYDMTRMSREIDSLQKSARMMSSEDNNLIIANAKEKMSSLAPNTSNLFKENLVNTQNLLNSITKDAEKYNIDTKHVSDLYSKYSNKYSVEMLSMLDDIKHSNVKSIEQWNTTYSNVLSELRKDFMNEAVDVNYEKVLDGFQPWASKETKVSSARELFSGTKIFANRVNALEEGVKNIKDPWSEVRKPTLWLELAGDFALGVGTTYAADYMVRGEDASLTGSILLGGGLQLATGAHILGNPKKYFAKPTAQ